VLLSFSATHYHNETMLTSKVGVIMLQTERIGKVLQQLIQSSMVTNPNWYERKQDLEDLYDLPGDSNSLVSEANDTLA
jgi:hypothetical protein